MSRRRFPAPGGGRTARPDPRAGMPVGHYDPLTPMGELEQTGKLIAGLSRGRRWRRGVARAVALIAVVAFLTLMAVTAAKVFGR